VERISQYGLYELGNALEKLKSLKGDVSQHDAIWPLMSASTAMGKLRKGDPLPLGVSEGRAKELEDTIDGLINEFYYSTDANGDRRFKWPAPDAPKIEPWRWGSLTSALEKFETVFAEDMRENATYYVPRRGIFFTKALVDSADEAFPADLLPYIPQKTREDWCAAGRCLAFNLLSASGFHVARAVEGTLEVYYQLFCGRPATETLNSWNDYLVALEKAEQSGATPMPDKKTLAELRQMKDDFRNPIAHPRASLNDANARILFNNGESLIIAMAQEISKETKSASPSLSLITGLTNDDEVAQAG
jgi:hypothetical protein